MVAMKVALIVVSITLIATVLLQSGKSAGLGSVGGGADDVFGDQGRNLDKILSKVTTAAAVSFMVLALLIAAL
jgi:preprotein translocase subunit SecG